MARPTMLASASGELYTRWLPKLLLQPPGDLEDAALALHLVEVLVSRLTSATSSPKTRMRGSRAISSLQAGVEQVDHRGRLAGELRDRPRYRTARRSGRRRASRRTGRWCRRPAAGRPARSRWRRRPPPPPAAGSRRAPPRSAMPCATRHSREASVTGSRCGVGLALGGRAVVHLVVGERMAVGPDHLGVHQRRSLAGAAVVDARVSSRRTTPAGRSRPLPAMSRPGKPAHQLRDRPAGGVAPRPGPRWRSRCPRRGRPPAA